MEEKYNFSDFSDSDNDAEDFRNTIEAIRKLDNHKQVLPAERSEPSLKVDEYHLTREADSSAVKLSELTRTLAKQPKHSKIAHDLKLAQKHTKTLPKPLEKPEANRLSRSVGFEKVSKQLTYWEPVVHQNRVAEHQVFPLPKPDDSIATAGDLTASLVPETDLEKRMAEILRKNNPHPEKLEDESTIFQLTLEEMIEKRKEAAKLRAQQSYMVAKARRQNKIKSKTYHRIARREKIRQQMKEFETLQQTNPEEALKRIEEIEKERALERVSLRHRNTGKWAKNQAVRAKYNKESRQILSDQLKLSRDLTKKVAVDSESSGEDDDVTEDVNAESDNPWVGGKPKTEAEVDSFISGYRKFWEAKHNALEVGEEEEEEEAKREVEREVADERAKRILRTAVVAASASVLEENDENDICDSSEKFEGQEYRKVDSLEKDTSVLKAVNQKKSSGEKLDEERLEGVSPKKKSKGKSKKESSVLKSPEQLENDTSQMNKVVSNGVKPKESEAKPQTVNKRKTEEAGFASKKKRFEMNGISNEKAEPVRTVNSKSGKWTVTPNQGTKLTKKKTDLKLKKRELNAMFNEMNSKLQSKVDEKLSSLKEALEDGSSKKKRKNAKKRQAGAAGTAHAEQAVASLRARRFQRPDEDDGLDESSGNQRLNTGVEKDEVAGVAAETNEAGSAPSEAHIDPNNFMTGLMTPLKTCFPDGLGDGDEGMDDDDEPQRANHLTISEAFADDDVVAEFEQEKNDEINKNKSKDIDLSLPGWGSWGGHAIKPNERKRKRFIIKAPEPAKRRDENKGNVFINEKVESKLKPQQVSELPFPFKSVKDFEASIGAPISNTFIPESAHRKLVLPKVITRTGTIIEPMSKDVLAQRRKQKEKLKTFEGKKAVKVQ